MRPYGALHRPHKDGEDPVESANDTSTDVNKECDTIESKYRYAILIGQSLSLSSRNSLGSNLSSTKMGKGIEPNTTANLHRVNHSISELVGKSREDRKPETKNQVASYQNHEDVCVQKERRPTNGSHSEASRTYKHDSRTASSNSPNHVYRGGPSHTGSLESLGGKQYQEKRSDTRSAQTHHVAPRITSDCTYCYVEAKGNARQHNGPRTDSGNPEVVSLLGNIQRFGFVGAYENAIQDNSVMVYASGSGMSGFEYPEQI